MKISHLIILGLLFFIILHFIGYAVALASPRVTIVFVIGFIFSILTILNLETGLILLIFAVPFTQQLQFGALAGEVSPGQFKVGTDDILLLFIISSWLVSLARRKEPLFLKTSLNWPIAVFFIVTALSFISASTTFRIGVIMLGFLHFLKYLQYVLVYFIVISAINNFEQIKKFVWMFFIVAGFIAVVHIFAMFRWQGFNFIAMPAELTGTAAKFYIHTMHAFESNATLGIYYGFFLSILMAIILDTPVRKGKVPLILFGLLLSFCLFNSYTRSAYLGLLVSFLILSLLRKKEFFLIVLLLIIFAPVFLQPTILSRITVTIQSTRPLIFDESSLVRIYLWKKASLLFLKQPIFGTGYWTSRQILRSTPHNAYLATLLETGIIGFAAFCWLIVRMFKNAIILMKKADTVFLKALGTGYIGGLAAILITCFFSEPLESFRMVGPLWFITGLITSANRLLSEKSGKLEIDTT